MHWPAGFVPGKGNVPKDDNGKVLLDNEVTYSDVRTPIPLNFGSN
jgi:hypothetical protein